MLALRSFLSSLEVIKGVFPEFVLVVTLGESAVEVEGLVIRPVGRGEVVSWPTVAASDVAALQDSWATDLEFSDCPDKTPLKEGVLCPAVELSSAFIWDKPDPSGREASPPGATKV